MDDKQRKYKTRPRHGLNLTLKKLHSIAYGKIKEFNSQKRLLMC
jgi:hypothetical protein